MFRNLILSVILTCYSVGALANGVLIRGEIVNRKGRSIPFANVALYQKTDSLLLKGTTSDRSGNFSIDQLSKGNYYLKVFFIGYEASIVTDISIDSVDINLGKIILKRVSTKLDEVTVVSEKGMFETEAGKMIYNVEGNINATGETANELLLNIPSVSVDMDDKVSVRGSKATILIDGIESGLSEMLDQIPANAIESIEVMTNPSVKYESKSGGSIINVKLKKKARTGYNGKIEAGAGTRQKRDLNALLGYNVDNWRFSGLVNYKHILSKKIENSKRTLLNDDVSSYLIQERDDQAIPQSIFSGITTTYRFKDESYVSLKYTVQGKWQKQNAITNTLNYKDEELKSVSEIHRDGLNGNLFNQFNLSFLLNQNNERGKLEGSVLYSINVPQNQYDQINQPFTLDEGVPANNYKLDNKTYKNDIQLFKAKLDYSLNIGAVSKLEAGVLIGFNQYYQDYNNVRINYDWNNELEVWDADSTIKEANFTNLNIESNAYALFSSKYRKYSFSLGARPEWVINKTTTDTTISTSIFKLVPSFHLRKSVSDRYFWEVSFTSRINPPKFTQLNPISLKWGSYSKSSGNPNLKPEFFYQAEWVNNLKLKNGNINFAGYIKNRTDVIGRWYFIEEEDGNEISSSLYENLGDFLSFGVDMSGMTTIDKLVIRPGLNIYYSIIKGDKFAETLEKEALSYSFKLGSSYKLSPNLVAQLSGFYESPIIDVYGNQSGYYVVDAGLRLYLFEKKGALILKVADIFNSKTYDKIMNQRVNYIKESHVETNSFLASATFSYKFTSFKKKIKGTK